jgi:hypothetical protein
LLYLARHAAARRAHINGNMPRQPDDRGHPNAHRLTAREKISQARTLREALDWLSALERIEAAADREMLEMLSRLPEAAAE